MTAKPTRPPTHKAFFIDGTAFCYRAFHAIRALSTSAGRPTNAVYGFATMLEALRRKEEPDYLAVAFDVGRPTLRHRKFEEYKIQRKPMPDELVGQLSTVKTLLAAYRIPVFECEGYEAEDVLATIVKQVAGPGIEVFLVTGDKDVLQLVNSHVKVYNPHKESVVLDATSVRSRYGVGPEQMIDLMALMGDAIDNIPGVRGIGEKTATKLIQQFGSLDALYQHLDRVESGTQRSALEASRDQAELSRELARITPTAPLAVTLNELQAQEPDWRALRTLFRELEFKRLLAGVDARAPAPAPPAMRDSALTTADEIHAYFARLQQGDAAAVWCHPAEDGRVVCAVADGVQPPGIVELGEELLRTEAGRRVGRWLADPGMPKLTHDAKTMMRHLRQLGLPLAGVAGDTMLAAHLLNPARTSQTLSDLSAEYLDEPLGAVPQPSRCAQAVIRLHALLLPKLDDTGLANLYRSLELPLVGVLAEMEAAGIAVNVPYLASLRASMKTALIRLTEEIHTLAGGAFNVNSPKQLAQVLFERLQLPVVKRTKTGPSTNSDVLQRLAGSHPLPARLIHYRELSKLVSTYVDALPELADEGRIHTTFNQTATATGRLSSSTPNLQNIPIKTELGRSIRKAFVPADDTQLLLSADYSQVELRILAHLSGDVRLTEAFQCGRDIHRFTASLIYGVPESDVQPEQRSAMKAVNFGILYGMSAHGLSRELGLSFEEAQAFIRAYFERYPDVRRYLDRQIDQARRDGFVQTLLGRRRYIPEVNSPDGMLRQVGERMAINAPVQGTAADLIKRAMVELHAAVATASLHGRMLLQVHDELVFETPRDELPDLAALTRSVMEGAATLSVPLIVTVKAGPNWLDLSPV